MRTLFFAVTLFIVVAACGAPQDTATPAETAEIAVVDTTEAARLYARARALEEEGSDPGPVEDLYREAVALQPRFAPYRVELARILQQQRRLQESETEYRAALADDPTYASAHNGLGAVMLDAGRLDSARAALDRAIALDPTHVDALSNRGLVAARSGDAAAAESFLVRAIEVGGPERSRNALFNLGLLFLQQERIDEAIPILATVVRGDPSDPNARVMLAWAYVRDGNTTAARAQLRAALASDPTHAEASRILAGLDENKRP